MPKQIQRTEMNSFLGGLATEFSSLNSPPNTASEIQNFELNRDGLINRRLGMDFEPGYGFQNTGYPIGQINSLGFNSFKWESAGGNPLANFIVFQVGQILFFYNADVVNFSGTGFVGTQSISAFDPSINYSMDSVEGRLVIVSGNEQIAIVEYLNSQFVLSYNRITTRDYWGVQETIDPQAETDPSWRPAWPNNQHKYNLMNQSWGITRSTQIGEIVDPVWWFVVTNRSGQSSTVPQGPMPSSAEQVWTGLQVQAAANNSTITATPFERMYRSYYDDALGAKFVTAKGYFIIDALNRGASRQQAYNTNRVKYPQLVDVSMSFIDDKTSGGASCVANYAGRFWYGGFSGEVTNGDLRSPNLNNFLFFSKLVKSATDIVKCYQEGDPTSRESSDVVDTDGGFVRISGAQQIVAIRQIGTALLIFATNGVWMLTGGTVDSGFSATNYKISQISTFGITSITSLIVEGDIAYFWAKDGIYQVARNQLGDFAVTSITLKIIQKFYQAIPNTAKQKAVGVYDEVNKKLRWVWTEGDLFSTTQQTHELILDTALNAFSHNLFGETSTNAVLIAGLFQTRIVGSSNLDISVLVGSDNVLAGTNQVVVGSTQIVSNVQYVRYLTLVANNGFIDITVSYLHNSQWLDWQAFDNVGVDAKAMLTTGAQTAGDSGVQKWIPYVTFSFLRTESGADSNGIPLQQSSCMFNVMWAFANQSISLKIPQLMQAYRYRKGNYAGGGVYDTGFELIQTKNKVRGNGRGFQLYLESEPLKDLKLLGWNMALTANQTW